MACWSTIDARWLSIYETPPLGAGWLGLTFPVNDTVPEPVSGLVVEAGLVGITFRVSLPLPVT